MRSPDDARQTTGTNVRDAANAMHVAWDVMHSAPCDMRGARAICHLSEAVLQSAQGTVQRTWCAVQGTKGTLHWAPCALHLPKDVKSAR